MSGIVISPPSQSLFEIETTGERLRQLLSLKIQRLDLAIEREKQTAEAVKLACAEQEQFNRDVRERMRVAQQAGAGRQTMAQLGGMPGVAEYMPVEEPHVRHEKRARQLGHALAEIRWLHDEIKPSATYKLSRADLGLFGNFSIPGDLHGLMAVEADV